MLIYRLHDTEREYRFAEGAGPENGAGIHGSTFGVIGYVEGFHIYWLVVIKNGDSHARHMRSVHQLLCAVCQRLPGNSGIIQTPDGLRKSCECEQANE